MTGKTGPAWPCSATTTSIKFLIRWSSYGFSKLVPTNVLCNHEETLRRPFIIYSLAHANANRKVSCSLLCFKSGASTLSEPPSRGIMYCCGFHGICRLLHSRRKWLLGWCVAYNLLQKDKVSSDIHDHFLTDNV